MCIFFNMYDTLGEVLYRTIVQKIGQISNIQRCQMEKVWKTVIRFYSILISSSIVVTYLYCNLLQGDTEVSANLYCNSPTSLLGRLRDYLCKLMSHTVYKLVNYTSWTHSILWVYYENWTRPIWYRLSRKSNFHSKNTM